MKISSESELAVRLEGGRRISGPARAEAPLVTIVVVVLRVEEELKRILENVSELDSSKFELIIIDGDSGQATVDILNLWSDRIDLWVSEPDTGLYDAMNKGAALARGHFIYHLNAGDRLVYLPVRELEIARKQNLDVATFPVLVDNHRTFQPSCGALLRFKNTLHHQGTFYRREAMPRYDLKYRILADFDANQRLLLGRARMKAFKPVVAHHASGGLCDSPAAAPENEAIILKNFGRPYIFGNWLLSEWSGIRIRNQRRLKRLFRIP